MARLTLKRVTEELRREFGGDIELLRGDGYHYVTGGTDRFGRCCMWPESAIYSPQLNALTLERWVKEVRWLAERTL